MIPRLFAYLSWRDFGRHRLRTVLTFTGIALGIAVIVAIAIVNRSLSSSFQTTIDRIAGKAVLQVSNGESGLRESLFAAVRDTPGVQAAAAVVEGFLPVGGSEHERLYVLGVDLLTDFAVRDHPFAGADFTYERALDFIANPDSIAITESFARRFGLVRGSRLELTTSHGKALYTVRALLKEEGTARVFGGNFALMDLPAAQRALGKSEKLDVVDITVEPGETIEAVRERLERRLQGSAQVERPRKRGEQIEQLLTSFRVGLFFVSLIALFVGYFLIYNTVAVSVVQRRREIGTLRCLGLRRRDLVRLIVAESLTLALAGSAAGAAMGWLLARAALIAVGETVGNLFSLVDLGAERLGAGEAALAAACGSFVAVLAALHPALEAARISPLENARQSGWRPAIRRRRPWSTLAAAACFCLSPGLILGSPKLAGPVAQFSMGVAAMLLFLLGLGLLCPAITARAAPWLWRAAAAVRAPSWAEARLASDSLGRNPARAGITVATMVISLAAIFTIAAFVNSVRGSLLAWVDQMVTADLIVSSGARTAGPRNVPLSEEPAAGLKRIPGVRTVDLYRLVRSTYRGRPILIESFSARDSAAVRTLPMAAGDGRETLEKMGEGLGVVVSESFQSKFGTAPGDVVELPTPSGKVAFRVLGIYVDYSSDIGSVLLDRALYKKYWGDSLVDAFDLWLEPGASPRAVTERIKREYGEKYQLFVSTHGELRDAVVHIMEQSFAVNYAVEIVAVVVAIFSVINTLLASVLDRAREIAVLRALGATRRQVRRAVVLEAAAMGLLGGILGLAGGSVMAYHHVVYNTKLLTGWTFQFHYPYGLAGLAVAAAVLLCAAASCWPARQAAAQPVVAAIGYE
ncbi:MAG TPA: ABC transporter permease [candidate division Zixibacteria bacterium]|nr:ABC transporter permease [candidate division Zixibacteria bacterium]